ncbi:hypothetical protein, conserved [Eimeria praecox]|uniref:Uncharacterized protein n=1 Tax=Eimeria praecox TaxID=51316 RepID=U6GY15_9EIME|nr:hypothetical protein, conserved [Eimeria praecox]
MLDASRNTMDKITSQNPQQIMEGLSDLAAKSRDEISARFTALQATMESYSKVDITNHVVSHMVDSVRPKNLAESLTEGGTSIQEAVSGYTKTVQGMMPPMDRIYELIASTFDVSAKMDQLKAIRIQDISPGKTIQDLAEFSDLSGAFETLRQRVTSVLEPVVHAVASMDLTQKFNDFTQRF